MNNTYPILIKKLCDTSLLYLYMLCSDSTRYIPTHKRNEHLIKFLKPLIKDTKYKPVRKDIKTLLIAGKKQKSNLEQQIIKLRSLVDNFNRDVEKFYSLLSLIEEQTGLKSGLYHESNLSKYQIFISEKAIDSGFNNAGDQIAPISIIVHSDKWKNLIELTKEHGCFYLELTAEQANEAQLLLHKVKN